MTLAAVPVQAATPVVSHPPIVASRAAVSIPVAPSAVPQRVMPSPASPQVVHVASPTPRNVAMPARLRILPTRGGRRGLLPAGYGYGGSLYVTAFDVLPPPISGFAGGPPDDTSPPPFLRRFAPPPRCPLIIKVGHGLLLAARTQIISGRPGCI